MGYSASEVIAILRISGLLKRMLVAPSNSPTAVAALQEAECNATVYGKLQAGDSPFKNWKTTSSSALQKW
jgi:hypothetical protein